MASAILMAMMMAALAMAARISWLCLTWRGDRLVTCPETRQPVGVALDLKHVAATGIGHAPALRLRTCTRWPERQDCGQECLAQIQAAPEGAPGSPKGVRAI